MSSDDVQKRWQDLIQEASFGLLYGANTTTSFWDRGPRLDAGEGFTEMIEKWSDLIAEMKKTAPIYASRFVPPGPVYKIPNWDPFRLADAPEFIYVVNDMTLLGMLQEHGISENLACIHWCGQHERSEEEAEGEEAEVG